MLKLQVCRTLQTEYMGARSCCFFSEKYTIIHLFVGIFMIYLQGTLISSKPSTIAQTKGIVSFAEANETRRGRPR